MALCGVGFGLFQSPNNHTILTTAPANRSGGASGMLGTARLTGQTIGATIVALTFALAPDSSWIAMLIGAVLAGGGAVLQFAAGLRQRRARSRRRPLRSRPAPASEAAAAPGQGSLSGFENRAPTRLRRPLAPAPAPRCRLRRVRPGSA